MIDWMKPLQTKDGLRVVFLAHDGLVTWVAMYTDIGGWHTVQVGTKDGGSPYIKVINVPEEVRVRRWIRGPLVEDELHRLWSLDSPEGPATPRNGRPLGSVDFVFIDGVLDRVEIVK
jgi:hypothetical protein